MAFYDLPFQFYYVKAFYGSTKIIFGQAVNVGKIDGNIGVAVNGLEKLLGLLGVPFRL